VVLGRYGLQILKITLKKPSNFTSPALRGLWVGI
jgi:hypothetical protein